MSDPYSFRRKQFKLKRQLENLQYVTAVVMAFILAAAAAVFMYLNNLPSIAQLSEYEPTLTSQVVSNDNVVIKTFGTYKSERIPADKIPLNLKHAIISIEDKNFYKHSGFDPIALVRSTVSNLKAGKVVQGASTITQQLARILFLTQEKTFDRKFKELIIAYRLEKTIPKNEILAMYLNNVYLGEGAYGVEAASETYFDKRVEDLTLAECALIAGLPQAPSVYSPFQNMDLAVKRRNMVLQRMLAEGYITGEQVAEAKAAEVVLSTKLRHSALKKAPYFVDLVMRELNSKVGITEDEIVKGGYKVYTTLNYEMQKAAEEVVAKKLEEWKLTKPNQQAAMISYDTTSGQILAYIGGKDYMESQFDRVSQAIRQPGSSFKVFVYTTAIESGMTPFTICPDAPVRIGKWAPHNYGGKYRGDIPLYKALTYSSNSVSVRLIKEVGVGEVVRMARRLGITTPIANDPTIALGSSGVKLIEMATAYGVFANGGVKVEPYGIERVETSTGRIIYQANNSYKRILDVKTVAYMVEMLKQVVKHGTGRGSAIGRPSAGKTGTTDSYKDAWFMGFTPDIVTGVWVGNDDNTSTPNLTGGSLPALIWRDYMAIATKDKPVVNFMYPDIIVDEFNDESKKSGELANTDEESSEIIPEGETGIKFNRSDINRNFLDFDEKKESPSTNTDAEKKSPDSEEEKNMQDATDQLQNFNPQPVPISPVRVRSPKPNPPPIPATGF